MISWSSVFIFWNDFEQLKFYCIEVNIAVLSLLGVILDKIIQSNKRHLILPIQYSKRDSHYGLNCHSVMT